MISLGRLGAILALGAFAASPSVYYREGASAPRKAKRQFTVGTAPNDTGPVIDSTPESKRARRRRLAKARTSA